MIQIAMYLLMFDSSLMLDSDTYIKKIVMQYESLNFIQVITWYDRIRER